MLTVFIIPRSEIKRVVSTTSEFQRTGADILQVSDNHQANFALYEQLTTENGLVTMGNGLNIGTRIIRVGTGRGKRWMFFGLLVGWCSTYYRKGCSGFA